MHIPFLNTVNPIQSIINKTRSPKENAKAKRKVKQTRCESCYRRNEKRCLLLGALHLPVLCPLLSDIRGGNTHIYKYMSTILWSMECDSSVTYRQISPKRPKCLHPLEAFNSTSNRRKQIPKLILWSLFK